jgi:predicted glycoside hydrolase/deacetylase ChbG (UPF0249 family)
MPGVANGLLIVNADDLGLDRSNTDAILECFRAGSISSATAMMWMADSDRAAELARTERLPTGLHLNLIEPFSAGDVPEQIAARQRRVANRLGAGGLRAQLYHPAWAEDFELCIADQLSRFRELYGREPTHVDGHRHSHLAFNALFARALGSVDKCRPAVDRLPHESARYKRVARVGLTQLVRTRFRTTDRCLSTRALRKAPGELGLEQRLERERKRTVELFIHPGRSDEREILISADWSTLLERHRVGSFADL